MDGNLVLFVIVAVPALFTMVMGGVIIASYLQTCTYRFYEVVLILLAYSTTCALALYGITYLLGA